MSARLDVSGRSAFTVAEFGERFRLGRTAIYEQIKLGRLRAVKVGVKTLILAEDAESWRSALQPIRHEP